MALKLMYITNNPDVAKIAETSGVDRIFVDMEYIGKDLRQGGMDTVQSHHTFEDVKAVSNVLTKSELLVRVNPIHEATDEYISSKEEIDKAIENGAKILMLPYFKTVAEVEKFISLVSGRAKTMLLIETVEAAKIAQDIVNVKGIDEVFVGLNDLSLGLGKKFMFQPLAEGLIDDLVRIFKSKNIPFGFGGLASLTGGLLPGHMVLKEHYRLGSQCVILSRSFCNTSNYQNIEDIRNIFEKGIGEIRECENSLTDFDKFEENRLEVKRAVEKIVEG